MTKRQERAEASKERIYDAAIRLYAEKGFEETSVKDITAAAGCSVGAFYHHFASKDGVLEETFRRADVRFGDIAASLPALEGEAKIAEYLARYARFVQVDNGLELAKRLYTPKNKLFVRKGRRMQTALAALIAEEEAAGRLRLEADPETACDWLFIGARGIVFHWCLKEGSFDLEEAMRAYARRALRGLRRE